MSPESVRSLSRCVILKQALSFRRRGVVKSKRRERGEREAAVALMARFVVISPVTQREERKKHGEKVSV